METTLHRQLKQSYASSDGETEVTLGSFRIDAIRDDELIEIQCASLSALRSSGWSIPDDSAQIRTLRKGVARCRRNAPPDARNRPTFRVAVRPVACLTGRLPVRWSIPMLLHPPLRRHARKRARRSALRHLEAEGKAAALDAVCYMQCAGHMFSRSCIFPRGGCHDGR